MKTIAVLMLLLLTASCQGQSFKIGSKVEVQWQSGVWYPATIVDVNDSQYKIHLDKDVNNLDNDQWIFKDKGLLRAAKANGMIPPVAETKKVTGIKGKRIEVNDRAYWYKATVLEQKGDLYKVHFDGYSSVEDKWVHRSYTRDLGENGEAVTVTCSFAPPSGNFTNASPASDALFKREVYDWYNRLVNGSLSRPIRVGVVFTSFERGTAYKNTVQNLAGRGATRKHEGAPVNATIYPVKMIFHVCEDYNGTISQKQVNSDFSFFINKDGEWTCSKDN
ncbi:MAG: hypothetical protein CFE21_17530 [Bacteroidetes bacterium B1(2017)]|nr:MAG: hypothetical protein CFE21_17530 [Bacteroidetes bacterium B1(2017)]